MGRPTLVGAGALGSEIGVHLASLGLDFNVYDPDTVEGHNLANQAYELTDIGSAKATALASIATGKSGVRVSPIPRKYGRGERSYATDVVIVAVDSMKARKEIFEGALAQNLRVQLVIDTRMGITSGISIAFNPNDPMHLKYYKDPTLYYDDKDASPRTIGACGTVLSIKCTASLVAAAAISQLITWFNFMYPDPDVEKPSFKVAPLDNEIRVQWNPFGTITRRFE